MTAAGKAIKTIEAKHKMKVSIGNVIAAGTETLQSNSVESARLDANALLAHVLGRDRAFMIAHGSDPLSAEQFEQFQSLVARRAAGEPLQYITGHQEFYKLDFIVTPDVLIPRPETELIVEAALELFANSLAPCFADICTGSGCIAISLLHELPAAQGVGVDNSAAALQVAHANAGRHHVSDRLTLIQSDLFSRIESAASGPRKTGRPRGPEPFDLIVSNPPYVSAAEMKTLPREVQHEPALALAAGVDGLTVIRRLLNDAPPYLVQGGYLIFEIGFGQHEVVAGLVDVTTWEMIGISNDLQGIPRVVILKRK